MQRDAHHQRLALGLRQHLVEIVDDHVGEIPRPVLARHDRRDVVHLLRIRDRQDAALPCAHPDRLIIHAPVQRIAISRLMQQVGRDPAFRDPWRQPALRRYPFGAGDHIRRLGDQGGLGGLVQHALAFGIGAPVAHHLVTARAKGGHQFGCVIIHGRIGQHADRHVQRLEHLEHPPGADPVAIVAPGIVQHIRLRPTGGQFRPQPFAKGEMFQVQPDVDRQPRTTGPGVIGAPRDRDIVVPAVIRQHLVKAPPLPVPPSPEEPLRCHSRHRCGSACRHAR